MENTKENYYSLKDIFRVVKSFLRFLKSKWWALLLASLFGAGLGAFYFLIQKPKYEGVCSFILEDKQSPIGGLNNIASQFGLDIAGGGGGSFFAGDNILDILRSQKVVKGVLLSYVDSSQNSGTLADLYLEFTGKKKAYGSLLLTQINFSNKKPLTLVQDSVLNTIYESVVKTNLFAERTNKKGTIIQVKVTSSNETFSRLLAQRLVQEASELYLNVKTGTALANINRMQKKADSLLLLLNNKSYSVAISQPLDANPGLKTSVVPTEIAMRDKSVITLLYTEVIKNLEASRMLLSQETPVIQVLDTPGLLLDSHKKGLVYLLGLFFFIAMVISILVSGVFFLFSKFQSAY